MKPTSVKNSTTLSIDQSDASGTAAARVLASLGSAGGRTSFNTVELKQNQGLRYETDSEGLVITVLRQVLFKSTSEIEAG